MSRPLTDRQGRMLAVLITAHQVLSTEGVARRMDPAPSNEQVVRTGKQLEARGLVEMFGVKHGPKKWHVTKEGCEVAAAGEAIAYAIVAMKRYGGTTWKEVEVGVGREAMIDKARKMLDDGSLIAASVQGRGTAGHPTPEGEVQVYRGVAPTFAAEHFWPVGSEDVERR